MNNGISQFCGAIHAAGLTPPDAIEADGKLHRFASNGKRGDDAGWYVLHGGDIPAGSFGDWRTGLTQTWRADIGRTLTPGEDTAHRAKVETMRREREADEERGHVEAARKAATILQAAQPAPDDYPYLTRKCIKAHGAKVHDGLLVLPMRDASGKLWNVERIAPEKPADGKDKKGLYRGRRTGCYFSIGTTKDAAALCIVEGFATGATIHEATHYPVAVAFNAGNLLAVAKAMRDKFPDLPLILCADDDNQTEGNPGLTKAKEAARAVGALLAIPEFGADRPEKATDFNDMHQHCGLDAVQRVISDSLRQPIQTPATEQIKAPESDYASHFSRTAKVQITCAENIKPEPIDWLWNGWLARGKLHIFAGQAGTGKTTIAIALAATVSIGGRFPDGSRCPSGNVLIWSGEDSVKDTLVPRLMAAGAKMENIHFIGDVIDGAEVRSFDPARDIAAMQEAVANIGDISMLIVDPVVNAVAGDSHKNGEVRRALQPLVDFGERVGAAVLGISHFSKGSSGREPLERVTGSLAFGALARIVLATAKIADGEKTTRIFCRAKSNIGLDHGGFEYDLHEKELASDAPGLFSTYAVWGNAIEGSAKELLSSGEDDGDGGVLGDAKAFLEDLLKDGPLPSKQIEIDAAGAGYSQATIRRAKSLLGIKADKSGMKGGWVWQLPQRRCSEKPEDAQQNSVSAFGKFERLQEKTTRSVMVEF